MYFIEMMLLSMAEQQLPPQEERANDSSSIVDDVVAGWPELEAAREFQTQLFSREVGDPFAAVCEYTGFAWARRPPEDAA
jgi:hypothetical protein